MDDLQRRMVPPRQLTLLLISVWFCGCFCIGGCRTLCGLGKGCAGGHFPEKSAAGEAVRAGAFAFHHLQLLPAARFAAHGAEAQRVLAHTRRSPDAVSIFSGRLCGDAGAHSSTDLRTEDRHAHHGDASVEAAGVTCAARKTTGAKESQSIAVVAGLAE